MMAAEFKRIREAMGLTQEELAELLGVTRVSVARYETSRRIPETVARLLTRIRRERRKRS
jgi:transcriptional regulator with XRE-family HTH domain